MARMDKTIKDYQEHLRNKGIKDIPDFIQSILDADITKGKYSRFLLDCYIQDKFREEDLKGGLESTIGQAITLFHKHKNKLPEDMRSVYRYDTPGSLWNAVKKFEGQLSGKEVKRSEQDRIYAETEFVYEDEITGFKIVSPLTVESAKWWGKGTRWCTSAEKNNMFKMYAQDAPLLILLMPRGEKLQLWKGKNIQFMDEADNDVDLEYIEKHWEVLKSVLVWLGRLQYIPEKYLTEELCKLAVQKDGLALRYVPKDMRTEEICKIALEQNGISLAHIPKHMLTEEICKIAIEQNGYVLQYIPEEMRTEELCKLAIQQNGWALNFVPENMRTEELCKIAVKNNGWSLRYVPKDMRTEEICKLAIEQNGNALNFVQKDLKTEKICRFAVQQNGLALRYIPEHFKTEELCKLAVQKDGLALQAVPEHMKTKELCQLALQEGGKALCFIPNSMKTEELCMSIVQQHGEALQFVPLLLRTEELCKIAIQQNGQVLCEVPKKWQEKMKQYIKPSILPQEKYQQVFSEIRSLFPDKSLSLKL